MDNSLQDSIDKHDQCVEQVVTNNTAANSSGSTGSGAEESEGGVSNGIGSGNENEVNAGNTAEQSNSESETNNAEGDDRPEPSRNGAKNQEIAPKDNDSAVCRLLKDELKIEADPKKQNELKEIYSNYDCRG
jgi:hypothetical protein